VNPTVQLGDLDLIENQWTQWATDHDGTDALAALKNCWQTISLRAQQALEMRFKDKSSRTDIATALDLSPDGAKNLMQRAKKALRECIDRKLASK
jgi:RNA polymerase sigma-70 factor (ECF subfamily)